MSTTSEKDDAREDDITLERNYVLNDHHIIVQSHEVHQPHMDDRHGQLNPLLVEGHHVV